MLKEEATAIKELFQNSDFDDFSASDGWLDCWKITSSVKERRIVGKPETCVYRSKYFLDGEDKRID